MDQQIQWILASDLYAGWWTHEYGDGKEYREMPGKKWAVWIYLCIFKCPQGGGICKEHAVVCQSGSYA